MSEVAETNEVIETKEDLKACPVCGETIKAVAIKCRFCGEYLDKFAEKQQDEIEAEIFSGHPPLIYNLNQYIWVILSLGTIFIWFWIKSRSVKYTITSQRIKIEKGLLGKKRDTIELFRVDDFELYYPFAMRVLGYGILKVKSSDRLEPDLTICGLPDVEKIYEKLRECSLKERTRRGVKVWANA